MEIDFQIVKRYLNGKDKKGEKDQIIDWFSDIRFEKDLQTKYRILWDELEDHETALDCDGSAILGRIYRKIKNDEYQNLPEKRGLVRILNVLSKVAAVLFIPLLAYLWISRGIDFPNTTETAYSTIHSPAGTRTMFYLPDGSSGWLNGGSSLKFPTEFRGKSREVYLKGEAYFDVLTDPKRTFKVQGDHTVVIAYGTAFNVQTYPEDPDARITLLNGSVSLYGKVHGKALKLADLYPNQMCTYEPDIRRHQIETVDVSNVTAWMEGKLAFRDEAFTDVVRRINRWYNIELIIMDEALKSFSYQATFMDETVDEILKLLSHSAPIEYKDLGRKRRADGTFEHRKIEIYYKP